MDPIYILSLLGSLT